MKVKLGFKRTKLEFIDGKSSPELYKGNENWNSPRHSLGVTGSVQQFELQGLKFFFPTSIYAGWGVYGGKASARGRKIKETSGVSFATFHASKRWKNESFDKEKFIPRILCPIQFAKTSKMYRCLEEGPGTHSDSLSILSLLLP